MKISDRMFFTFEYERTAVGLAGPFEERTLRKYGTISQSCLSRGELNGRRKFLGTVWVVKNPHLA